MEKYLCEECNKKHSNTYICFGCGKEICFDCTYSHTDGHEYCPSCYSKVFETKTKKVKG